MRDEMLKYLNERELCVISSINSTGAPESAYVGYSSNQGPEIIIGTSSKTRKYANLLKDQRVSIVVADFVGEVQYEGLATEITEEQYDELVKSGEFKKLPGSDKYREDPTQVWFKISPVWARFMDHTVGDRIEEFTEFAS
jgi:nitroimidazol reductase NimA-like FMN-containing flavoprotein (pyridoxamine 5'-phosphate oxidase superfamily)